MKYSTHLYAKALAEVVTDPNVKDKTGVAKNFLALILKNGDSTHLAKILNEAERIAQIKEDVRKVVIKCARPLTEAQRKEVTRFIEKGDVVEEVVDPSLVAGIRIIVNDEREFDGSLAGKLDKLFGNIT